MRHPTFHHPEVRAKRASKDDGLGTSAASFEARLWRAPQDDGEQASALTLAARFLFAPELCGTPLPKTTPNFDLRQMPRPWKRSDASRSETAQSLRRVGKGAKRRAHVIFRATWASLPLRPPYETARTNGKNKRKQNAERRTVNRRTCRVRRAPCGTRSPSGVPLRLLPGRQLVPKAQRRAMLRETVRCVRSCTAAPTGGRRPCASPRALPAPEKRTTVSVQRAPRAPVMMPAG
jgi:hypothetical protein